MDRLNIEQRIKRDSNAVISRLLPVSRAIKGRTRKIGDELGVVGTLEPLLRSD